MIRIEDLQKKDIGRWVVYAQYAKRTFDKDVNILLMKPKHFYRKDI